MVSKKPTNEEVINAVAHEMGIAQIVQHGNNWKPPVGWRVVGGEMHLGRGKWLARIEPIKNEPAPEVKP